MDDVILLITIFILGPALIAYFAVRGYRNIARREAQQAAEAEKAARAAAAQNSRSAKAEQPGKAG